MANCRRSETAEEAKRSCHILHIERGGHSHSIIIINALADNISLWPLTTQTVTVHDVIYEASAPPHSHGPRHCSGGFARYSQLRSFALLQYTLEYTPKYTLRYTLNNKSSLQVTLIVTVRLNPPPIHHHSPPPRSSMCLRHHQRQFLIVFIINYVNFSEICQFLIACFGTTHAHSAAASPRSRPTSPSRLPSLPTRLNSPHPPPTHHPPNQSGIILISLYTPA